MSGWAGRSSSSWERCSPASPATWVCGLRCAATCGWPRPRMIPVSKRPCASPSAPVGSRVCSPSASVCWVPRSLCSSTRGRPPRSSRASALVPPSSPCSCAWVAESSPRPRMLAPISSARLSRASPRMIHAMLQPSLTTWATTWATAPAWPRTSLSPTPSRSLPRSSWARLPSVSWDSCCPSSSPPSAW